MNLTNSERAQETQRRRKAAGLCVECGDPSVDGWRCDRHKNVAAIRQRNYYRLKHGLTPSLRPITPTRRSKHA